MKHRLTASALGRARQCLYSFREDVPIVDRPTGPAARLGNAFHKLAECYLAGVETTVSRMAVEYDLAPYAGRKLREMWHQFLGWWPTFAGDLPWRPEVPFAADVDRGSARIVRMLGEREYDAEAHEIPGRADAVAVADGVVHVIDWKTGAMPIEEAETNPQMGHLGACGMTHYDLPKTRLVVVRFSDLAPWCDEAWKTRDDAAAHFDEMAILRAAIPSSEPVPSVDEQGNPSGGCRFCPAREACPAWTQDVELAMRASLKVVA